MPENDLVDVTGRSLIAKDILPRSDSMSFNQLLQEAMASVEEELSLEDLGWARLGQTAEIVNPLERVNNLRTSRIYATKDPLGKQSIRLWTDYTFGSGMTFQSEEEQTQKVIARYWTAPQNKSVLSARGQRKSSDKLLIDGEVFFVLFLGPEGKATIRWIDPLEITEIITDPDDIETVLYYDRTWSDRQGRSHRTFYRSPTNLENKATINAMLQNVSATDDGIVFHLTYNTITQRGNPLLLPVLAKGTEWLKQYRKFLAARVAIMLALTRFAWKSKIAGGQAAVDAQKAKVNVAGGAPEAASWIMENMGSDTTPIKTETGAKNAYDDARMLRLQLCAAVGIPEQYFGDISSGNLATAKTVELPMMKQFQSLQKVWADFYQEIDDVVLKHNDVPEDKWYIDRDFPLIAPRDVEGAANAIEKIIGVFPQFAESQAVQQMALLILGIDNTGEVLASLEKELIKNPDAKLARLLREVRKMVEQLKVKGDGNGKGKEDSEEKVKANS